MYVQLVATGLGAWLRHGSKIGTTSLREVLLRLQRHPNASPAT